MGDGVGDSGESCAWRRGHRSSLPGV